MTLLSEQPAIGVQERSPLARHIRELDGVRAVAVTLVFLNHFAPVASLPRIMILGQIGWIGVDIFFVLSGFLITGILLDSKSQHYYRNFYVRRALRIFPLYYALLTVLLLWMMRWKGGAQYYDLVRTWGHPAWLFAYLGNIKTAVSGISPPDFFSPMWSLHVEEQFYVVFPFVVHRLRRETLQKTLITVVVCAPIVRLMLWWLYPERPLMQYMLLPCRMDGLALGALIALRLRMGPWHINKVGLASLAAGLSATAITWFVVGGRSFDDAFEVTFGYSLFAAAFACWVLWIVSFPGSSATSWLNARPLQFVGKISYGIYLLQMPAAALQFHLASALRLSAFQSDPSTRFMTLTGSLALWILCIALATLSWYALERPFLRLKDRLTST